MLRGALRKPKRVPAGLPAAAPTLSSPRQHTPSTKARASHTASRSRRGVEGGQPLAVDVPGGLEERRLLAVEDHADVEELLAVDARHAAEHDVLVGQAGRAHAALTPGSQARVASRAERNDDVRRPQRRRATRRRAPARARRRAPRPRPPRRSASVSATSASTAASRSTWAPNTWSRTSHGLGGEPGRVADAARPAVVEVERRAVVDHPEVVVPQQQVGVAPGAVDVRGEGVEPEHPRGRRRPGSPPRPRSRRRRAGSRCRG